MNETSDVKRLADAVTALAATMTEIMQARLEATARDLELRVTTGRVEALLNKKQVAKWLGVTARTVDVWMTRRILPYLKLGRTVRFRTKDVEAALDEQVVRRRRWR